MTNLNFNSFLLKKIALEGSSFGVLTANKYDQYQNVSAFDSATLEDLKSIDIKKLLQSDDALAAVDENATADQKALAEMVKAFLEIDGVQKVADADGNGELNSDEALEFLQNSMAFDGDLTSLTMDDLDKVVQSLNIDLNDVIDKAIEESLGIDTEKLEEEAKKAAEQTNSANGAGSTGSVGSAGGGSYSPRSTGSTSKSSAANQKSTEETVAELEQQIKDKEGEITAAEEEADAQIQEQEDAKKKAMEQAGVSEKEYQEYKKQEEKIEKSIKETDKEIDEHNKTISDNEATISSNKNYIGSIESEISNNETALGAVTGDDDAAASKKASINEKISNLKDKKASVEEENKKLEEKNAKEKEAIQTAETKKKELETQKQELLSKTLQNSEGFGKGIQSSEAVGKIKEQIATYDTKIAEIRSQKQEKVAGLRSEIQELNVKLNDAKQKEERDGFLKENSFLAGEDVLELANKFEGKTQDEMRQIMREAGYQFDDGAWCADFVSFIAGQTIGEENLPDWYKNCNRAYCPDIQSNAKANGAFVGEDQAKPGDAVLFDWDGDGSADHIGYVTKVNGDGTVETIEGNTSGNNAGSQVASKQRNRSNILGYVKLT